jgi:hypothetical protein
MKTINERLKSPVVQLQLISILAGVIIVLIPEVETEVKAVVGALVAIINIMSGLNNPTNKEGF